MTDNASMGLAQGYQVDVLVVDDNAAYRASCAAILRRAGYTVEEADDAFAALERLRLIRVGALVLDVRMPGLDGLRFLELLDDNLDGPAPPVLVTTAYDYDKYVAARSSEAFMYLQKPITPEELRAAVARLLAGGASEATTRAWLDGADAGVE